MKNEEDETSLKEVTITFRHSENGNSPISSTDEIKTDNSPISSTDENKNGHSPNLSTNEARISVDANQEPTIHGSRLFRRRKRINDDLDEEIQESSNEFTNIQIEGDEDMEEKEEGGGGNRIWASMKSAFSCFYVQHIDSQKHFSHRISSDRMPNSIMSDNETYFSEKFVYRREGEVVKLISINETVYQKFPDEVFGNHSSEMFFWPFLIPWQVMMMTILVVTFEIVFFNVCFDWRFIYIPVANSFSQYMVFWVLQMIYLIDFLLTLVNRQWNEFQIKHTIVPRNRYYIAIDLLVLLPTFMCSYLLDKEKFYVHTVQIFALHRIFLYTRHMTSTLTISRFIILFLCFMFIWMFNIALSSLAFGFSCFPTEEENNWLCGKGYWYKSYSALHYMDKPKTEFELYALSKLHALFLLPPLCEAEYFQYGGPVIRWMYIIVLISILLFSYLFVVPLLSRRIFKNDYMWISFSMMRYKVIKSLTEMKFTDIPTGKVDQFFSYAWRKRRALLVEGGVTQVVAPELWLSVHHDIYQPAFAHSQLFAGEDHCYLRSLACRMQSVLLMEGDVILRKQELAARMIYVVEGSIQILTTEDDTTPQMVLGAGTVIGETSLLISYFSKCYICCHSMTCEIHVLDKLDFIEISCRFKRNFQEAMKTVKQRYQNAKLLDRLNGMIKAKVKKSLRLEEQLVTSTDWLKFKMQLNHDSEASAKSEEYAISGLENWYIHASHTLSFLGQLAVPQIGSESVADPVLLKLSFPFIFQPNSRVHQFWYKLIFLSVCFLAIYLPYSFSFSCSYTPFMRYYPVIYLIIYVLDILLQVSTSVQTKRGMSIEISEIIYHLIQKPLFVIDLVSTLPLFLFSYVIMDEHENLRPLTQVNQLFKIYMIELFLEQKWIIQTEYQFYWRRLIKYVVYFAYLLYITTCLLFAMLCANDYTCLSSEVFINTEGEPHSGLFSHQLLILGLYKTSSYYFGTISLSVMEEVHLKELIPYALIRFVSYFMNIYILSSLISIKAFSKEEQFKFNENVKSLLMMTKDTPRMSQVTTHFQHSSEYKLYKYAYFLRHEVFLPGMPSSLGMILKSNVFMKVIMEHPIFLEMPRDLVMRLANHFQLMTIPSNQVIVKQFHPPKCMYFIINGVLKAFEDGVEVKKRLRPGHGVGVLEVCFNLPYMRSIICETDAEVIVLDRQKFKRYVSNNHQGTEPIKYMMELYRDMIAKENKERADTHQPVIDFLSEKSVFLDSVHLYQPSFLHFSITRNIPNMFRRIVSLVRTNTSFHPHSEFVYKLQFFHAALAISAFIFYPLQPVLVNCYMPEITVINLVLIGLNVLLIYLQSCIAFYDPVTGILVTRRGKALRHYLEHSMCLDIFTIIPFEFLPISDKQIVRLLLTYNRLLQIYRFVKGMNYLERKYKRYQVILTFIQFIVILCLILNALSSLVLVSSCELRENINLDNPLFSSCLKCDADTLISSVARSVEWGGKPLLITSFEAYLYSAYFAITTIMCNALQNLVAHNPTEVLTSAFGPVFGLFLFLLYTSVFVNTVLDINHAEYQYCIKVERLLHFYNTLEVPEDIKKMTKSYLSSMWNFNRSLNLINILKPLNSCSRTDILFQVFVQNLLKNNILHEHAPYMFFDKLFDNVSIRYFSFKCYIILSGDIINELYFVTKGYVHIFDSQKSYVGTVGPGSIFGTIGQLSWCHQRFSFVAASFVETLVISSLDLHRKVLLHIPKLKKFFTEERKFDMLVEATDRNSQEQPSKHRGSPPLKPTSRFSPKKAKNYTHKFLHSNISFHDFTPPHIIQSPPKTVLLIWTEFFVFLCTLSCSLTVYCLTTYDNSYMFYCTYYAIDFLKIINIFFRQQKISPHVKSNLPIVKNRNFSILFDIFISFPVDSFFLLIGVDNFLIYILKINRLFALLYVRYHWMKTCKRSMKDILAKKHSKFIFAIVLLNLAGLFIVSLSALLYCLWADQEKYVDVGDNLFKQIHFLKCVAFIIGIHLPHNIKTASMFPKTKYMLIFNVVYKLLSPFIFAVFLGYVYVCICRSRFCYPDFLRRSTTFLRFMRNQRVAYRFFSKVNHTFENNWYKFQDSPVPELFFILPYHIQAAVRNHAFGEHVYFNIVFYGCNSDFLRQVIGCLKVLWLQPGDKIVKIFSRNGCMYFVVDGIVVMNNSNAVTVEILEPWDSFGMAQGIDPTVGHAFNYIAHSNCCIAYLDYNDWSHLGDFHPESMKLIRERIDEINVKIEDQYGTSRFV